MREFADKVVKNRKIIQRRTGQAILLVLCLALAGGLTYLPFDLKYTVPAGVVGMLVCFLCLFLSDCRWMKVRYHFTLFPPGSGTLRTMTGDGSSRFLSLFEYKMKYYWRGEGIFLGRPIPEQRPLGLLGCFGRSWVGLRDDRHILTVAPTRNGKGTAALVPNLLLYKGSALVIDPKGGLARITAARRGQGSKRVKKSLNQHVVILDLLVKPEEIDFQGVKPARLLPEEYPPARWNPLAEFPPDDSDVVAKVQGIVFALIPPEPGATDSFFINQSRGMLTMLILHVLTTEPEENRNLIRVRRLLSQGDTELFQMSLEECEAQNAVPIHRTAQDALFAYMHANPSYDGKISGFASQLIALDPQTRSNVLGDLYGRTNFLDLAKLEYMLQGSDFRLSDLKRKPMTLYVCAQGTRLGAELKPIITILLDLAIKAFEATPLKPKRPVLFIMDEFSALGRLDSIDLAMGLMAEYGVKLWPVVQSIDQLKTHYPTSWDNFRVNCGAIQYMGEQTGEVLRELEARLGCRVTIGPNGQRIEMPLLSFQDLTNGYMHSDSRRELVMFKQEPAAPLELCDYFRYRWLNKYAEPG